MNKAELSSKSRKKFDEALDAALDRTAVTTNDGAEIKIREVLPVDSSKPEGDTELQKKVLMTMVGALIEEVGKHPMLAAELMKLDRNNKKTKKEKGNGHA